MTVDFDKLQSELSEVEMALLVAVNVALNASLVAGASAEVNLAHLKEHEDNFNALGQGTASHVMAALRVLHKNTAGIS